MELSDVVVRGVSVVDGTTTAKEVLLVLDVSAIVGVVVGVSAGAVLVGLLVIAVAGSLICFQSADMIIRTIDERSRRQTHPRLVQPAVYPHRGSESGQLSQGPNTY